MSNKEVARAFQLLASMMELHGENEFRIRSYRNAYNALKRTARPLDEMSPEELSALPGIGKSSTEKIRELLTSGSMKRLEEYKEKTPPGVQEMLMIKGFGPRKVLAVWKELGIESPGELLYACNENRLVEVSGFGLKTQSELKKQLTYFLDAQHKYLYAAIEPVANEMIEKMKASAPGSRMDWVGEFARCCPVINTLEILVEDGFHTDALIGKEPQTWSEVPGGVRYLDRYDVVLHQAETSEYDAALFVYTGSEAFVQAVVKQSEPGLRAEEAFVKAGIPYVIPEMREDPGILEIAYTAPDDVIEVGDLQGILHNHSTYSDGLHSLHDMATYVQEAGYSYLGITDHSKTAVYASGLHEDEVIRQHAEIDQLNAELAPFRIFKGIESDILNDGSLDYPDEILETFDVIVASIHSNLRMDEEKATQRLVTAIENPHTDILGHLTGRLLLSRPGYPVNHMQVIDACAANGVAIELNANPQRLDMDYRWIPYAVEKGVLIAINPDAHSKESIHNVQYGVLAARKGGLTRRACLNCLTAEAFAEWLATRKI